MIYRPAVEGLNRAAGDVSLVEAQGLAVAT